MQDQDHELLYYKRFYEARPHFSGKPIICGHTVQGDLPSNLGYAICLDTCAYGGGWLTAFNTKTKQCWQTNEKGKSREIEIFSLNEK
jgi:serine/threonine protein phosphatase 1